eukprot:CAMPEP_0170263878 /NCGR_PEP_ID=MMETSP0116_2-20130129/31828_1 /TAXON_ID=400756 /ORGANISM="Durinskia baltica, Strain CSIRO CS-38" /LENGTH=69 /DNA_ID=CAMNT_0010514959 /DNA_START=28 /DNA_END=234 /DNA_ORIENTATION=-
MSFSSVMTLDTGRFFASAASKVSAAAGDDDSAQAVREAKPRKAIIATARLARHPGRAKSALCRMVRTKQ